LKAKRANSERVKEFSKQLLIFNKEEIKRQERDSEPVDRRIGSKQVPSAREKAIQFAKQIPKPKGKLLAGVKVERYAERDGDYGDTEEENCIGEGIYGGEFDDLLRGNVDESYSGKIQELQAKHGENRRKADAIKKSLGLS
jgi:hypothetical protein